MFKITAPAENLKANGLIAPWNEEQTPLYSCPWLIARSQSQNFSDDFWNKVETLLILQDWGCLSDDEDFSAAVDSVKDFFKIGQALRSKAAKDTTFRNLWDEVPVGTQSGNIALTNAIWGLRSSGEKTGYLGSKAHKAWFHNWALIVKEFLEKSNAKQKRVIFCGEWARAWGAKEFTQLSNGSAVSYLKHYATWAGKPEVFNDLPGKFEVYFFRHPSASGPWVPRSEMHKTPDLDFKEVENFNWS